MPSIKFLGIASRCISVFLVINREGDLEYVAKLDNLTCAHNLHRVSAT